jgi:hypothetical protein
MKKEILSILTLAFLSFSGSGLAADSNDESSHERTGASPGFGDELTITLHAPLMSPHFSETPVAVVNDEPIAFRELATSISSIHTRRVDEPTSARKDYANLLVRIITTKLIVQEARNIGLDEMSEIKSQVDGFSMEFLISRLMAQHLKNVEPDAKEVDELYERISREFLLTTVKFKNEEDAVSFEEQVKSSDDFNESARGLIEEGRAEGEIGGEQYTRLKDLLPRVAQEAFDMDVGSVSPIFKGPDTFLMFHIEDARFYEDPMVKEAARKKVVESLKRKKAREYGEFLEAKHALIDEDLLEEADFEVVKSGFLWFGEETPADYEKLLVDERVVATVRGDESFTVTVADLAREVQEAYFHRIDKALEKKELNQKKRLILKSILFKKIARMEAVDQGMDETKEYFDALEKYTSSLLFRAFVNNVIAPDVKISEEELREYYREHVDEFSPSRPYDAARGEIARIISEEKVRDLIEDWSKKLKEAYETRIFVTGLDDRPR